jgi:hypothetical protein
MKMKTLISSAFTKLDNDALICCDGNDDRASGDNFAPNGNASGNGGTTSSSAASGTGKDTASNCEAIDGLYGLAHPVFALGGVTSRGAGSRRTLRLAHAPNTSAAT